MGDYQLLVHDEVRKFLTQLDDKSERICRDNIAALSDHPYPGRGKGDKEQIVVDGEDVYRLHISRSFTAFYEVDEGESTVRVLELLPIDEAHNRYGH